MEQVKEIVGMLHQEWKLSEAVVVAKEEGAEERALKIAKNLRAKGMGVDEVAEATGLTVDDVLRL
jgi:predicted transposase/invertase (TIGR01784 family)